MEQSFLKFTVDSLTASYIPFPRFLMEGCTCGALQRRKGTVRAYAGQSQHFKGQRFCRGRRHHPPLFHRRTGAEEASPQPPKRDTDISAVGVQRIDLPSKARSWQTCDDHDQLPFQCEADTTEGRQRITVRIKVENRIFYAPQETQAPEGHIFTHRAIKTYLRTVNGGTE